MSKILRALLISAVATGVAAVVLRLVAPEPPAAPRPPASSGPYVDADHMTAEQKDLLMRELETQL